MDPVLDETSLMPCSKWTPTMRITALAKVLQEFDRIGLPRVLRSVADAADRDIAQGRGLRSWCFDNAHRDAGRLVASRLARQPFIDGPEGLMTQAEGARILETQHNGQVVYGLGLGALEDCPVASLASATTPVNKQARVLVLDASTDPVTTTVVLVPAYSFDHKVAADALLLQNRVDAEISNGQILLDRFADIFPHLRVGLRAERAFAELSGAEPVFGQLIRHLRALNTAAEKWEPGVAYQPQGITFSPESESTLSHSRYGPIRDFPPPAGFEPARWSFHTKLTGGAGSRLYFRAVRTESSTPIVLIGYFGPHLSCVSYPT